MASLAGFASASGSRVASLACEGGDTSVIDAEGEIPLGAFASAGEVFASEAPVEAVGSATFVSEAGRGTGAASSATFASAGDTRIACSAGRGAAASVTDAEVTSAGSAFARELFASGALAEFAGALTSVAETGVGEDAVSLADCATSAESLAAFSAGEGGAEAIVSIRLRSCGQRLWQANSPAKRAAASFEGRLRSRARRSSSPNSGHHHLLVDAPLPPLDKPIPNDENHLHFGAGQTETTITLPTGRHTLQLLLGDVSHLPHEPPVYSTPIVVYVGMSPLPVHPPVRRHYRRHHRRVM